MTWKIIYEYFRPLLALIILVVVVVQLTWTIISDLPKAYTARIYVSFVAVDDNPAAFLDILPPEITEEFCSPPTIWFKAEHEGATWFERLDTRQTHPQQC
jgi:hypothetical protein